MWFTSLVCALLAKQGRTQWRPDLIYFSTPTCCRELYENSCSARTPAMFICRRSFAAATTNLAASCVQNPGGDVILNW